MKIRFFPDSSVSTRLRMDYPESAKGGVNPGKKQGICQNDPFSTIQLATIASPFALLFCLTGG